MPDRDPYRICFVCTGNICRSPTAEVVTRRLVADAGLGGRVEVASAGLGSWHAGGDADERAVAALRRRGYQVPRHRARVFAAADFARYDLVIALDAGHERSLRRLAPDPAAAARVGLLRRYDPAAGQDGDLDVPDPYYGGNGGFEQVLDLVEAASRGLVADLRDRALAP